MSTITFPFTAIVGQETFKLALLLNCIDPSLGGVLAIGDKGTGKTTLVRSLASLMSQQKDCPFVNLPLGASEDSVLGQLSLGKLINEKEEHLQLGLLAKAHQGFLYVDEINLLNDYLMDVLLDAAATGTYFLEREGFSRQLDSRFCLIGSMNPEEGDLRPQLKDRFGLCVTVQTPQNLEERVLVVQHRLAFDENPHQFYEQFEKREKELLSQIQQAKEALEQIVVPDSMLQYCAQLALNWQVEGLRADILLVKAARAFAALKGAKIVDEAAVQAIAELVLYHRGQPPSPSTAPKEQSSPSSSKLPNSTPRTIEESIEGKIPEQDFKSMLLRGSMAKQGEKEQSSTTAQQLSMALTAQKTMDKRKTVGQYMATNKFELKQKSRQTKVENHLIFVLDSTGSMLQQQVVAYAKGLLQKWCQEKDNTGLSFSLIVLFNDEARLELSFSKDKKALLETIEAIQTGGKTNILAALKQVKRLTTMAANQQHQLVLISDGRFQSTQVPSIENLVLAYQMHCKLVAAIHIVDTEVDVVKVGWGKALAKVLKGTYECLKI